MFKRTLASILGSLVFPTCILAQIYVKSAGNVGIGIANPSVKLQVNGKTFIDATPTNGDGLSLNSASSPWVIMNYLRGGLRHAWTGLEYNEYCIAKETPGNIVLRTVDAGRVIIESASTDNNIGGSLYLRHTGKGNSTAGNPSVKDWVLYNMSGIYGNSLQFWAYDNTGCAPGGICNGMMTLRDNGNLGIGCMPAYKLDVAGDIRANTVWAYVQNPPDYVFDSTYPLRTLQEVDSYIKQNHHLPEVPSANEIKSTGLNLAENQATLLQKIEELTLYAIDQHKAQQAQNEKLLQLEKMVNELAKENNGLKEKLNDRKSKKRKDK